MHSKGLKYKVCSLPSPRVPNTLKTDTLNHTIYSNSAKYSQPQWSNSAHSPWPSPASSPLSPVQQPAPMVSSTVVGTSARRDIIPRKSVENSSSTAIPSRTTISPIVFLCAAREARAGSASSRCATSVLMVVVARMITARVSIGVDPFSLFLGQSKGAGRGLAIKLESALGWVHFKHFGRFSH